MHTLVVWYFYREKTCDALTLHYHEANAAVIFAFLHSTILILNVLYMMRVVKIGALVSFWVFHGNEMVGFFFVHFGCVLVVSEMRAI